MKKNEIINSIYQNVLTKFYNAMQNITIEQEKNNIDYIKNQFNDIIELLKKCQSGTTSIESIKLLNDISFDDFLRDKHIIEAVNSNHAMITDNNIFIMKMPRYLDDDTSYFRIIERDGHYAAIMYHDDNTIEREILLAELNSFISLDKALNDSEYIGYSAHQFIWDVTIIYSGKIYASEKYFTLYKGRNGTLKSCVTDEPYSNNGFFQQICRGEKSNPYIKSKSGKRCINNNDGILDRAFILKVIEEQLDKKYRIPSEEKKYYKTRYSIPNTKN